MTDAKLVNISQNSKWFEHKITHNMSTNDDKKVFIADQQLPISSTLKDLKVGESATYPILRLRTVRSQASELGAMLDRVYSTCMNREARTITVIRKA